MKPISQFWVSVTLANASSIQKIFLGEEHETDFYKKNCCEKFAFSISRTMKELFRKKNVGYFIVPSMKLKKNT